MRIALVAEGTRGDIHPMLALADALRDAGHEVRICAPPGFRDAAEACNHDFRAVGVDVHQFLSEHRDALAGGGWRAAREAARYFFETLDRQFESVPDATRGAERIFAAGTQLAASSAAELHGVPYRYIAYCPVMLPSNEHPPFLVAPQRMPRWLNWLIWNALRIGPNRLIARAVDARRKRLGLGPVGDPYMAILGQHPLLASDPLLGPAPADAALASTSLGCLHRVRETPLPEKLEDFLDSGPAPVYFGFGSMTDGDPDATTRLLLDVVERVGCRAVVSAGWAGLGGGPLPERVLSIGPVSHDALFPRVAAVVHHGGAGTTTTAARAGTPQVLVPHVFDQHYWARRISDLGLGPGPLPRSKLAGPSLAAAIQETLENEIIAARAREVGAELRPRGAAALDIGPLIEDG